MIRNWKILNFDKKADRYLHNWRFSKAGKTSLDIKFKRRKRKKQFQQILLGSLKGTASQDLDPYFLMFTQPVAVCYGQYLVHCQLVMALDYQLRNGLMGDELPDRHCHPVGFCPGRVVEVRLLKGHCQEYVL